jgi:hypothetical protein
VLCKAFQWPMPEDTALASAKAWPIVQAFITDSSGEQRVINIPFGAFGRDGLPFMVRL